MVWRAGRLEISMKTSEGSRRVETTDLLIEKVDETQGATTRRAFDESGMTRSADVRAAADVTYLLIES
jgi:hypothetical protein